VLYTVKERPTGALLLGIGFSSVEQFAVSASIRQANAFGSGKFISANVNSGSVNTVYALSYNDPYYTVDGVSQGFDIYKRETDASNLSVGPYATDALGGGIKFGYPVSEIASVDVGLNLEDVTLTIFSNSPLRYLEFVDQFGTQYRYAAFTAGWQRDTRDSIITTTSGTFMRVGTEIAGGDLRYYRLGYQRSGSTPCRGPTRCSYAPISATPTDSASSRCLSSRCITPAARTRCAATAPSRSAHATCRAMPSAARPR
jgi:outer membrane protein insertion porin family